MCTNLPYAKNALKNGDLGLSMSLKTVRLCLVYELTNCKRRYLKKHSNLFTNKFLKKRCLNIR
jgi:hypothetical protein